MNTSPTQTYDPTLHEPGSLAALGFCSQHGQSGFEDGVCTGQPVVSFVDRRGHWQSGCSLALQQLVDRGEIEPLGQGA